MVENFFEQRRDHLGSPMNSLDGLVEFVARRGREEGETRSLSCRPDGFQPGRAGSIGILIRTEEGDDGGGSSALLADGGLGPSLDG